MTEIAYYSFDSRAVCTKLVKNLALSVSAMVRVSCCSGASVLSSDRAVAPMRELRHLLDMATVALVPYPHSGLVPAFLLRLEIPDVQCGLVVIGYYRHLTSL